MTPNNSNSLFNYRAAKEKKRKEEKKAQLEAHTNLNRPIKSSRVQVKMTNLSPLNPFGTAILKPSFVTTRSHQPYHPFHHHGWDLMDICVISCRTSVGSYLLSKTML